MNARRKSGAYSYYDLLLATLDAHAIVSIADSSGEIVYANKNFSDVSGYPTDELIGENHRILRSGEHSAAFFEEMWWTISRGEIWHGIICNRRKDGGKYWVETTIVPFLDRNGLPEYYCSVRTDVTKLMEMQHLVDRSQQFARAGSWDWKVGDGVIQWSAGTAALFGNPARSCEVTFDEFVERVHPEDRERLITAVRDRLETRSRTYEMEHRVCLDDGRIRWMHERGDVVFDYDGTPVRMLGLVQDITERREAEQRLADSERLWRGLMEQSRDAVVLLDTKGLIVEVNSAAEALFGYARDELVGRDGRTLFADEEHASVREGLARVIAEGDSVAERRIQRADGRRRLVSARGSRVEIGDTVYVNAVFRDITHQHLIADSRDHRRSAIDRDTGLMRAERVFERLEEWEAGHRNANGLVGVAVVRLENLAEIEAGFGGEISKAVLVAFSERLREAELDGALAGRVLDGEFVLAWFDLAHPEDFDMALTGMSDRFREPFDSAGQSIYPRVSIGTTLHHRESGAASGAQLLSRARVACNHARESVDTHVVYDGKLERRLEHRLRMERAMRRGLVEDAFRPVYQPQVDLTDGRVCGVEVLARWQDQELGRVSPQEFIGFAEQTGLLNALCDVVFRRALSELKDVLRSSPGLKIALNVSPVQLRGSEFIGDLDALIAEIGVNPGDVELEITETAMVEDLGRVTEVLREWRRQGFRIAIDDFGTGFSSMAHLRHLPIDRIKIDRSFVQTMDSEVGDAAIVKSILGLARPLGYSCVAEGIESRDHLTALRYYGCDVGQGYFIGKPMPLEKLIRWLGEWEPSQLLAP